MPSHDTLLDIGVRLRVAACEFMAVRDLLREAVEAAEPCMQHAVQHLSEKQQPLRRARSTRLPVQLQLLPAALSVPQCHRRVNLQNSGSCR
jgi:hypothetical protein